MLWGLGSTVGALADRGCVVVVPAVLSAPSPTEAALLGVGSTVGAPADRDYVVVASRHHIVNFTDSISIKRLPSSS